MLGILIAQASMYFTTWCHTIDPIFQIKQCDKVLVEKVCEQKLLPDEEAAPWNPSIKRWYRVCSEYEIDQRTKFATGRSTTLSKTPIIKARIVRGKQ